MNPADDSATHRLFAAIVLMGTGLTLGCGGVAESDQQLATVKGSGGDGAGGNGAIASGGSSGGAIAVGGASVGGAGSSMINGGADQIPVTPGPFACPPQRWSCAPEVEACGLAGEGWALPDGCACDATRPERASDCSAGQVFLCRNGTSTADGHLLSAPVAFECVCAAKTEQFCREDCSMAYQLGDPTCQPDADEKSALCGCAAVFLK